ncbi:MAG: insulinase family protein, partial [Muribaculaceae bacterium]|nr:insulinase family protein [Muribaculaceae bacterium]
TLEHHDYVDLRCAIIGLGGYFGSRLMTEVRERQGLTYGISAALFGYPEAGIMMIASQTDNRSAQKLIEATKREILQLQEGPMGAAEFERLRRYIYSQLLSTLDNPFTIMDYYETLKLNFIADGYFQRQIDALSSMTPERLRRVMADHIDITKMKTSVAGNRESLIV